MRNQAWWWIVAAAGLVATLAASLPVRAQTTSKPPGVGRPATGAEVERWGLSIGPNGENLPSGGASAVEGRVVYERLCARCHGPTGTEGPDDRLVGGIGTLASGSPVRTVGSYWPYATTLWDYVNRAMPFDAPGVLTPDEVYGSVAYVLFLNGIIAERDRMDASRLPQVRMPNRGGFVADPRPDVPVSRPRN
jgi:cytochrome c